jgi:hypothetical protein
VKKNDETEATGGQVFTNCPNWGKGGHYRINPETGERESYDPNQESVQVEAKELAPVEVMKPVTNKEKNRVS